MAQPFIVAVLEFSHLGAIAAELEGKAAAVVKKTAFDLEAHAKSVVPVDTGNLKGHIETVIESGGLAATVTAEAEYGIYIEMGTAHMPARPYMTPAAELVRGPFEQAMKKVLG